MSDASPTPDNLHDSVDRECVARVSEQFEQAWCSGERPRLRRYLAGLPQSTREALFRQLLRMEVDLRRRAGEIPTADEYRAGFPEHLDAVDDVFASLRRGLEETRAIAHAGEDSTRDEPEELPETGERYQIVGKVGRGAFATVYLAHDVELDRPVALKVPHREPALAGEAPTRTAGTTRSNFEQLKTEARRVARLDHAGIVPVYDVGRTVDGRCFLVSKLIEGTSLDVRLHQGKLPPAKAAAIVADAAEALHAAHIEGLVHRDVKPANIMLTPAGRAVVTDFGLALHEDEQRARTAEISGSPCYMAPEQTRGETRRLDGRTDIWALGVVLYRALCGRLPFVGDTWEGLADEIRTTDPRPPRMIDDAVPAELERITLKCLAKNVADRYTTAADLARDLRNWEHASDVKPAGRTFQLSLRALGIGISITLAFSLAAVLLALPHWGINERSTAMQDAAMQNRAVQNPTDDLKENKAAPPGAELGVERKSSPDTLRSKGDAETDRTETEKSAPQLEPRRPVRFRGANSSSTITGEAEPGDERPSAAAKFERLAEDAARAARQQEVDRLLKRGLEKDVDSAERFALLQLACEQAVAADDDLQAQKVLSALAGDDGENQLTEPQPIAPQFAAADKEARSKRWRAIADEALTLAERARSAKQDEHARVLAQLAVAAAEKSGDAALLERFRARQRDLEATLAD